MNPESFEALLAGEVVYRKVSVSHTRNGRESSSIRIIGYRLIDKPRESLWLAALAYDAGYSKRLTEHLVGPAADGEREWYQHVDMPWPLKDRHWLIRTAKNLSLAEHCDNRIWEHRWALVADAQSRIDALFEPGDPIGRVTPERAQKSVPLPLNNGAWVMASAGDLGTLVVVHATLDMGGIVPDGFVARQTRKNLVHMLEKIEQEADSIWASYSIDYLIYRGDGTPIAPREGVAAPVLSSS